MTSSPDVLAFSVSTENLNSAIDRLRALGGLERYPEAYQVLVFERSRRELQAAPQRILLTRDVFAALPVEVQQLMVTELT
jgi:hypothetical protein